MHIRVPRARVRSEAELTSGGADVGQSPLTLIIVVMFNNDSNHDNEHVHNHDHPHHPHHNLTITLIITLIIVTIITATHNLPTNINIILLRFLDSNFPGNPLWI